MDYAVAQLALVFLPGLIWASIDSKYGTGLRPDQFKFILRSFLFGISAHATLYLLYLSLGFDYGYSVVLNERELLGFVGFLDEIAFSIPLSFALSILWLFGVRYRLLKRLLHWLGATKRYGDEDVWSYVFNSDQPHVEYVHIRDIKSGYVFAGWVNVFSENEPFREIMLIDAIVYDEEGEEISSSPHLYIAREKTDMWIEFPYSSKGDSWGPARTFPLSPDRDSLTGVDGQGAGGWISGAFSV